MIKDESGLALPLVIVVAVVLSLIGIILYNYNMAETTQVARDEDNLKAHYIARSGAHALASYFVKNNDIVKDYRDHIVNEEPGDHFLENDSNEVEFRGGHYRVKAEYIKGNSSEEDQEEDRIMIISTGEYGNARQRIGLKITIEGISAPVICNSIDGNIASSLSIENGNFVYTGDREAFESSPHNNKETLNNDVLEDGYKVEFADLDFDEVIYPWDDDRFEDMFTKDPREYDSNDWEFYDEEDYDDKEKLSINEYEKVRYDFENNQGDNVFRPREDLEINATGPDNHILFYADNININNYDIKVTLGNNNVVAIVVDDDLDLGGDLIVEKCEDEDEGGYLLLYVKDFTLGGNSEVGEDVNVNMYVLEGGEVDIAGTPSFRGTIYGPDAEYIHAGNTTVVGWIIANEVDFSGGGTGGVVFEEEIGILETSMDLETVNMKTWHDDITLD